MSEQALHVLVIDGDEHRLERVGRFLGEYYFYTVETANDLQLAWQLFTQVEARFHVVLIDDAMSGEMGQEPKFNSLALLSKIKAHSPETEIIIYTDRRMPNVEEALRAGAFRYLTKPFNMMELAVMVRHAAEHQQLKRAQSEKKAFEVLLETSAALLGGHTQKEALDLILKGVQAIGFDRVCVYLLSEDERYLVSKTHVGMNGNSAGPQMLPLDSATLQTLLADPHPRLLKRVNDSTSLFDDLPGERGVSECSCVSLQQQGKGIGLILADNKDTDRPITDVMLRPLSFFASQAAATIENRFFREIERKARNLQAVLQVSIIISSSLALDQTLQSACRAAVELIGVDHSGIVLFNTDMESGEVRAEFPDKGAINKIIQIHGVEAEERLVGSKKPLLVSDVEKEFSPGPVRDLLLEMDVRSMLIVPVMRQDEVLGSFSFDSIGRTRNFTKDEIELCTIFAAQVAVAIENARLFEETNKQKDHFKRLLASSPNGMLALDIDGNITSLNERATQMLKYTEDELIGKPVKDLYYDPDEQLQVCEQLRLSPNNRIINYKATAQDKNGEKIPVHISATWLYDPEKNWAGSLVFFEDLRSIQEAERGLDILLEASNIITRPESLEIGLQSLAEMVISLLKKTFCQILLRDESGLFLIVKAAALLPTLKQSMSWHPGLGQRIPKSEWPQGLKEFLREGQPTVITSDDENDNARLNLQAFSQRLQLENDVKSLLLVPLRLGENIVGLLCVAEVNEDRREFSPEEIARASAIAVQTTTLIEHRRQFQITERSKRLLALLDAALLEIGDEKDTIKLQQEIVRLAAQLFDCEVAGLCINRPQLKEMVLTVTYGLPTELVGEIMPHAEGTLGAVASTGKSRIVYVYNRRPNQDAILRPFELQTMVAVPLKQAAGAIEAVLFVADRTDQHQLIQSDVEILERFAARASIALSTSRLISDEQRVFDRLTILQKISDYLQKEQPGAALEKILHVVLTGVTAGYGLGFNRAVLFLRDEVNGDLVGRKGIGQLSEREARRAWESDHDLGLYDFVEYIRWLEKDAIPSTPVGELVVGLRLPVTEPAKDAFSSAVINRQLQYIKTDEHDQLPTAFRSALNPSTPVTAVPLIARDHVLGLLVVDNKFTQSPITHSDFESLLTFANTVAIALDNITLFQQTEQARLKLSSLYKTSNELVSRADHKKVLEDIVDRTWLASGAMSVRLILIDEMGRARMLHQAGDTEVIPLDKAVRPDGIAAEVMMTGEPFLIKDKMMMAERINPLWMRDRAVSSLCLPLSLQEKRIGVMWINYEEARHFTEFEVNALQLYANQAAIAYDSARRMEELDHMRQVAFKLAAAAPGDVLSLIVRSAREVLQADSAAIWSYDDIRHIFVKESSAVEGIPAEEWEKFWKKEPRENGTARTVMEKRYVPVEDIMDAESYAFLGNNTRVVLGRIGVESFQGIALVVGDEILGILYVNYNQRWNFTEEEQQTARTFANQASLALKKARLLDQVNRARDAALVMANVTALEKDLQKTLKAIVEGTCKALDSDVVTLYTYEDEHRRFGFPPAMEGVRYEDEVLQLGEVAANSVVRNVLALDSMYVANNAATDPIVGGDFVRREGIKSSVGIPLIARGRKVGVMFVNFLGPHRFSNDERMNIELFAKQAAVAIRNGQLYEQLQRLYEQLQRRVDFLESLYEAGSAITGSLDLNEILRRIAEQTWKLASSQGEQDSFVEIKLIDGTKARLAAAHPPEEFNKIIEEFGEEIDLEKERNGKIGILGRAVREEADQIVNNVEDDTDYIEIHEGTKSQLVVLLRIEGKIIGTISVEHPNYDTFDEDIVDALKSLAAQAAVSIQNARRFEDLTRIKGYIGNRTALEWIKMVSYSWGHSIRRVVGTARSQTEHLEQLVSMQAGADEMVAELSKLKNFIAGIAEIPIVAPLSKEDDNVDHVQVNDLANVYLTRQWKHDDYKNIELVLEFHPRLDALVTVRASRGWLRQAFEIFIENAVREMKEADSKVKRLTFKTSLVDQIVKIEISDTGPGIPPNILNKIVKKLPIDKEEGERGAGIGLVLAHTIIDTYGGKIDVRNSGGGVVITIDLPAQPSI
jgi:PAS domain S-box-containing protein